MLGTILWSVTGWLIHFSGICICGGTFVQEGLLGKSQTRGREPDPLETDPEAGKQGVGEEVRRAGVGEHRSLHGRSCRASRVKSEGLG